MKPRRAGRAMTCGIFATGVNKPNGSQLIHIGNRWNFADFILFKQFLTMNVKHPVMPKLNLPYL
jgi:hypothetical protein